MNNNLPTSTNLVHGKSKGGQWQGGPQSHYCRYPKFELLILPVKQKVSIPKFRHCVDWATPAAGLA